MGNVSREKGELFDLLVTGITRWDWWGLALPAGAAGPAVYRRMSREEDFLVMGNPGPARGAADEAAAMAGVKYARKEKKMCGRGGFVVVQELPTSSACLRQCHHPPPPPPLVTGTV